MSSLIDWRAIGLTAGILKSRSRLNQSIHQIIPIAKGDSHPLPASPCGRQVIFAIFDGHLLPQPTVDRGNRQPKFSSLPLNQYLETAHNPIGNWHAY
ncbi:MAG: hypothetical protein LWW83_05815 [Azonexaceae bacterium]|uniref:hypothetical protein n=1 Tax=Azonexus sp. R2A61 TaxID=2744443 RepID=UPI001F34BFF0|nr:hypothetical protein [Azonexus sp. R2A61]MCE1239423.1 hypothetical protein [Azonexaceae bacterium]